MPVPVRVGVIGLGRLWETRHKPALVRLSDRFQVVAVYDQVNWRAVTEAQALGCAAAESISEIVERHDVDLVSLLAPQWFGDYAAQRAIAAGKSLYWGLPIGDGTADFNALAAVVRPQGIAFVPELPRRFYPATSRLRELLATSLGPPRLVLGHARIFHFERRSDPGPSTQLEPLPLEVDPGANLIDWCRYVFGQEPLAISGQGTTVLPAAGGSGPHGELDFGSFQLDFLDGGHAQVTFSRFHRSAWNEATAILPHPGFQVFAERGVAWLELPDRISWTDSQGRHEERLPLEPSIGALINDQLHRRLSGEESSAPTLDDALAVAELVALLAASRTSGRKFEFRPSGFPDHPAAAS